MGLFEKLFGRSRSDNASLIINDPILGEMEYDRQLDSWLCWPEFKPLDCKPEVSINAGRDEIDDNHREAWRCINDRFDRIRSAIAGQLLDYWKEYCADEMVPPESCDVIWKHVKLESMGIENADDPENPFFEMCFEVDFNPHYFTFQVEQWEIDRFSMDG